MPVPGFVARTNSFPATIAISPDGRYAALLNQGYGTQENGLTQSIAVLNLDTNQLHDFPDKRLRADEKTTLQQLTRLVQSEVREARAGGGRRHSADLMQDWNDRMNDMLGSSAGRFRLWIRRHPWFTLVWLASIVPIAYFVARSRI